MNITTWNEIEHSFDEHSDGWWVLVWQKNYINILCKKLDVVVLCSSIENTEKNNELLKNKCTGLAIKHCYFLNQENSLVPIQFKDSATEPSALLFEYGIKQNALILETALPSLDAVLYTRTAQTDYDNILETAGTTGCRSWLGEWINWLLKNKFDRPTILLGVIHNEIVLSIIKNNQLQLQKNLLYQTENEVASEILQACSTIGINNQEAAFFVYGTISANSPLYSELEKFYGQIAFMQILKDAKLSQNLPIHQILPLYILTL
jgi:hypothetical protein